MGWCFGVKSPEANIACTLWQGHVDDICISYSICTKSDTFSKIL